jgi:two-component system sensor histidine kinase HupT/HoxJ
MTNTGSEWNDDSMRMILERVGESNNGITDETAWIEVIQRMDSIYSDIVRYQVELEEKNAGLEEAQSFIHSVISSMSDILIVADTYGRIQQVNRALEDLIGRTLDDIKGQHLSTLFTPEYAPMAEDFAEHIRANTITDCEINLVDASGQATPIAINCTPRYDHDGRSSGLVITGRPLGELQRAYDDMRNAHQQLKAAQQQLVQSEKMASLGQLVAGVAHELNNPISFVFGNMHALMRYEKRLGKYMTAIHDPNISESERDELRKDLKIDRLLQDIAPLIEGSLEGAERISEIVEDLRRFSTPNQQQLQTFELSRVIRTATDWVVKAQRERPEVDVDLPDVINITGYEGYVHQILVNLVQNASDAVEEQPQPHIWITSGRSNGDVWIKVRDNGPGIRPDDLLRIFDPFYTTKAVGKGTGLGLYISYNLATDQCGGKLKAENHPDGGAVFTLSLPIEVTP